MFAATLLSWYNVFASGAFAVACFILVAILVMLSPAQAERDLGNAILAALGLGVVFVITTMGLAFSILS